MVAHVLLDGAIAVIAADHRIGQVKVFDQRFELPTIAFRDLATEDGREFRGLPNGAIRIEQALTEGVQCRPPAEDQVVRVLDLREEEPMLTARGSSLRRREERGEGPQPLLRTAVDVAGGQAVGEGLQSGGIAARQERIGLLAKPNPLRAQAGRDPVMLIEAHSGRERKIGAQPYEHPAPLGVVQVEVVLDDPPSRVLEMPAIRFPDRGEDPRGLTSLDDHDDLIGLGSPEVRLDECVPAPGGGFDDRRAPLRRPRDHPPLILGGDVGQDGFAHRIQLSVRVEEPDDALRLLERLDQSVDQDPIEAPVPETNAILVMLVEGVHGHPPGFSTQKDIAMSPYERTWIARGARL